MNFKDKQNLISCYFSRINILYRKIAKNYGLPYNTMLVLYVLKLRAPCSQKQIVEEWEIPKQTVNTVIKELEEKGYIHFSFENNKKEKTIFLSETGEQLISSSISKIEAFEESIYEEVGEDDCDVILNYLEKVLSALDKKIQQHNKKAEHKKEKSMKGLVVFSSNTGNTKTLATEIYNNIRDKGEWTLEDLKNQPNPSDYDVILLGGWAESGNLNKASLEFLKGINKENKKLGLFITMGSRTSTEHGQLCEKNLTGLLKDFDSLGVKLVQGKISEGLMNQLAKMPESAIPQSVKVAMKDGFENYKEPSQEEYKEIAGFFSDQL